MIKKYKKFILSFVLLLVLISLPQFILALEMNYPSVKIGGGEYTITEETSLFDLIAYIYYFVLGLGGIIVFVMISWGGIEYLSSLGNIQSTIRAKKRIFAALLGLLVLLSSFLILKTVSPDLVILKVPTLEKAPIVEHEETSEEFAPEKKELEISYPAIRIAGKKYTLTKETGLAELVAFIYYFILSLAGIIALGALIFGGVNYLLSTGKPEATLQARKQVFAALLGLVILLSSFLILKTVNPDLIVLKSPISEKSPITGYEEEPQEQILPSEIPEKPFPEYIKYIFNLAIGIGGLLAFGVLVYGGFLYLTSAGDPEGIRKAKDRFFGAILGLIILLFSYSILTNLNHQLVILKIPFTIIPELKSPEIPEIGTQVRPGVCQEISLRSVIEKFIKLENGGLFEEGLDRAEKIIVAANKVNEAADEVVSLSQKCNCNKTDSVCFQGGCCSCPGKPPFCVGEPCPNELKNQAIPYLEEEIAKGRVFTSELEETIQNLDKNMTELKKVLEEIKTCRANPGKQLFSCSELKYVLGEKKQAEIMKAILGQETCSELNFYCCD